MKLKLLPLIMETEGRGTSKKWGGSSPPPAQKGAVIKSDSKWRSQPKSGIFSKRSFTSPHVTPHTLQFLRHLPINNHRSNCLFSLLSLLTILSLSLSSGKKEKKQTDGESFTAVRTEKGKKNLGCSKYKITRSLAFRPFLSLALFLLSMVIWSGGREGL